MIKKFATKLALKIATKLALKRAKLYVRERIFETSSWRAIILFCGGTFATSNPEMAETFIAGILAVVGFIGFFLPDWIPHKVEDDDDDDKTKINNKSSVINNKSSVINNKSSVRVDNDEITVRVYDNEVNSNSDDNDDFKRVSESPEVLPNNDKQDFGGFNNR